MKSKNLHVGESLATRRPWLAPAAWALVIFVLSSLPGSAYPTVDVPLSDKGVHFLLYGILGALSTWALRARRRNRGATRGPGTLRTILGAVAIATVYGVLDEVHQRFVPGRSSDPKDVLADFIGAWAGSIAMAIIDSRRHAR